MTQKQLAEAVGLDASAISRLEQGVRAIRLGEAALIAEALKCDIRQLLYGPPEDQPDALISNVCMGINMAYHSMIDSSVRAKDVFREFRELLGRNDIQEYLSDFHVDIDSTTRLCDQVLAALDVNDKTTTLVSSLRDALWPAYDHAARRQRR